MPKKILVCDNEREWLTITEKILKQAGYEVVLSMNGKDALQKTRSLKPDLIILDIKMPGMDGYEICSIDFMGSLIPCYPKRMKKRWIRKRTGT